MEILVLHVYITQQTGYHQTDCSTKKTNTTLTWFDNIERWIYLQFNDNRLRDGCLRPIYIWTIDNYDVIKTIVICWQQSSTWICTIQQRNAIVLLINASYREGDITLCKRSLCVDIICRWCKLTFIKINIWDQRICVDLLLTVQPL